MKPKAPLSFKHELTFTPQRPKTRRRRLVFALLLALIAAGAAYVLSRRPWSGVPETVSIPAPETTAQTPTAVPAPQPQPAKKVDVEYVVRSGDTLGQIFARLKLDVTPLPAILAIPTVRDAFKPLQPGDKLTFTLENGALYGIEQRISDTQVLSITRGGGGFDAKVVATPIEIKSAHVRGTIDSSLFAAGHAVGLAPEMVRQLVNDIFGWDIDFARDIRPGDRFNVVYARKYRGGEYLGDGPIMAAEFVNDGQVHRAVRYTSPDGKIDGYFTPDGHSVRRAFLRAPIDVAHVGPRFDRAHRIPRLDTMQNPGGIDYPAPAGTTIEAAGDGRVSFVGVNGDYGNTVVIAHGGAITTLYAHLSAFAHGLQPGEHVTQGETIGYVGSSGAATAPHLHYEYRIDGTAADPDTIEQPAGAAIPPRYRADFRVKSAALLADLQRRADAVVTASLAN